MSSSITLSGSGSGGVPGSGGGSSSEGDPRPSFEAFVSGLEESVRRADTAFQIRQIRGFEALDATSASELLVPDALDELVPRLAITTATFSFWVETREPDFGTGVWAWFRRKWRDVKRAWNALLGRPIPPTYTSDLVPSSLIGGGGHPQNAIRVTLTLERQQDGTFEMDVHPPVMKEAGPSSA